jgi:hypothetical protein
LNDGWRMAAPIPTGPIPEHVLLCVFLVLPLTVVVYLLGLRVRVRRFARVRARYQRVLWIMINRLIDVALKTGSSRCSVPRPCRLGMVGADVHADRCEGCPP